MIAVGCPALLHCIVLPIGSGLPFASSRGTLRPGALLQSVLVAAGVGLDATGAGVDATCAGGAGVDATGGGGAGGRATGGGGAAVEATAGGVGVTGFGGEDGWVDGTGAMAAPPP